MSKNGATDTGPMIGILYSRFNRISESDPSGKEVEEVVSSTSEVVNLSITLGATLPEKALRGLRIFNCCPDKSVTNTFRVFTSCLIGTSGEMDLMLKPRIDSSPPR